MKELLTRYLLPVIALTEGLEPFIEVSVFTKAASRVALEVASLVGSIIIVVKAITFVLILYKCTIILSRVRQPK